MHIDERKTTFKFNNKHILQVLAGFASLFVLVIFFTTPVSSITENIGQQLDLNLLPESSVKGVVSTEDYNKDISSSIEVKDTRAFILDSYFKRYNSPLYGTGSIFVNACDKFGAPADCLTVAAIAKAETDLCNYYNSASYHNCWGFGGGGANRVYFDNWEQSIDRVTDVLVNQYGRKYITDPRLMERVFCGWEPGCTGWGARVLYFMDEINEHGKSLGFADSMMGYR